MAAHPLTGNKDVVLVLHKFIHSISYNDVRMQNKKLASSIKATVPAHFK